jgi:sugar diacid utilization regulator
MTQSIAIRMTADLQELVDGLAEDLGRSVSLEDRQLRLLNYSTHEGPVDQSRYDLLLARRAAPSAVPHVLADQIHDAREPLRVRPDPSIGIEFPRVVVPVRHDDALLGFLIVIDPDDSLDVEGLTLCQEAAALAGAALNRERVRRQAQREHETELLADLLGPHAGTAAAAAEELRSSGVLTAPAGVAVLVVRIDGAAALGEDGETAIVSALGRLRRYVPARTGLELMMQGHGAFLLSASDRAATLAGRVRLAERLRTATVEALRPTMRELPVRVAIGECVDQLERAARSYETALLAADVAEALRTEPVVTWEELGVFRLLARFPLRRMGREDLPSGLVALLDSDRAEDLVATLEAYFELAGDVKATAERLVLHRASLYHRLQRIERITGMSLRSGDDSLALQLGLKLARLMGELPGDR